LRDLLTGLQIRASLGELGIIPQSLIPLKDANTAVLINERREEKELEKRRAKRDQHVAARSGHVEKRKLTIP
jgi:hypothetical protein